MVDIEIKRGYEVLPDNNVRFGIRVINNSDFIISDVEVVLDYNESLFKLEGNKIQNLGTIPPTVPRTAKFVLKPLGCIHKEEIGATILYKDHQWKRHTEEMRPKEVHCVCPFLKEKAMTQAQFFNLTKSGNAAEQGVNFENIDVERMASFLTQTCRNRLYKVSEYTIENGKILYLASESIGERAYYLLTAVIKEYEGLTQIMLRANSDKSYGLNGFLNEILDNLRHVVETVQSAREIGIIKKEQVINIIDSVVQKTTFAGGEGAASVNIRGSVVQHTEIRGDEEKKRREEERARREKEEKERRRRERGEDERTQKEIEELERLRRAKEIEERGRKAREESMKKAQEEAERRERERQKPKEEEELQRRQIEEQERIARVKEELGVRFGKQKRIGNEIREQTPQKKEEGTSHKMLFTMTLLLVVLLGYWALAPGATDSTPAPASNVTFSVAQTPGVIQTSVEDIEAKITTIWGSNYPVVLFGQNAVLGQVVSADLDSSPISEPLPVYTVCIGPRNSDKSVISRFKISDTKVRIVVNITGGKGFNPGSEGSIKIVNPEWKITEILPGSNLDMNRDYYGTGINIDKVNGLITWSGRGGSTAAACNENEVNMQFIMEKVSTPDADQKTFTNSIGMEFVQIPAGEFNMGSEEFDWEKPVHRVKLSKAFYMGKYEVTQKQWREVMGNNPSNFKGDSLPVEQVSWDDAQKFIKKLNEKEGTDKYRLPSEAEWEYAARADTTTKYSFGDDESKLGDYTWYDSNSGSKTHEVGQKKPNPWGLYDMHGNVWEWVQDIYHNSYNGAPTDGSAWEEGDPWDFARGGGWYNDAGLLRSANRGDITPVPRSDSLGFRLLRDL